MLARFARSLSILTLFAATWPVANASTDGWRVGLGVVSTQRYPNQDKAFFPVIETDNKRYMLIPNVQYQFGHWTVGVDGLGWQDEVAPGIDTSITVGYPRSSFRVGGQKGWFRYGVQGSLQYSDDLASTQGITLGPFTYSTTTGYGPRQAEFSQSMTIGFPLYLNKELGITVIGSGFVREDNAEFSRNDLDEPNRFNESNYYHRGVKVFSVSQLNPKTNLILSGTYQQNDVKIRREFSEVPQHQFDLFALFNYQF